ncbi:hypothetical protein ALQ47_02888 [Pseudomonas cichorii]|nr:hypothetical protein ALQ47_02888 [Pseudomonas cichorii]
MRKCNGLGFDWHVGACGFLRRFFRCDCRRWRADHFAGPVSRGCRPYQCNCHEQVSVSATITFARKGMIEWREGRFLVLCGFIGGASGALLVSSIDKRYLEVCVPVMLILVALYFAFSPKIGNEDRRKRIGILLFSFTVAPALGFYDGIFGPGVGSFFIVGFVLLCGLGMMRAMSFTKLANASCNLGSLSVFITKGVIVWPIAIAMALAAFAGAQLGARAAVRVGPRLIKPMLVVVCCALAIKLLSVETNPLRLAFMHTLASL